MLLDLTGHATLELMLFLSRPIAVAAAVLSLQACQPAAIDIVLSLDGDTSDPEYLFANLTSLRLTLDAEAGLYPAGAERELGDLTIGNYDGDPASELRFSMPMKNAKSLPIIRVEQGGLPSASDVEILIDAMMGSTGKTFASTKDGIGDLSLAGGYTLTTAELKLALAHQAPRVMQTGLFESNPATVDEGVRSHTLRVNFSYLMASAPFYSGEAITLSKREAGIEQQLVPSRIVVTDIKPYSTYVDLEFAPALTNGDYVLRVLPVVKSKPMDSDIPERQFDQYPSKSGSQAYEELLVLANPSTIAVPSNPNIVPAVCGEYGGDCPSGTHCVADTCQSDVCPDCVKGSVCHGELKLCVVDCRDYRGTDGCLASDATCDSDGICRN